MSKVGLFLLLFGILGLFVVVKPQIATFSEKAKETKSLKIEAESYDARLQQIDSIKAQGPAIQETLSRLYFAMPKEAQIPETLVMVESLISSSGASIGSLSIGTPSGTEVPVNVSFSGSLQSINDLLDAFYKNIRTVNVHSQSISSDPSGNVTVSLQAGLVYQGENPYGQLYTKN